MARVQIKCNPPNENDSVPLFGSFALVLFWDFYLVKTNSNMQTRMLIFIDFFHNAKAKHFVSILLSLFFVHSVENIMARLQKGQFVKSQNPISVFQIHYRIDCIPSPSE